MEQLFELLVNNFFEIKVEIFFNKIILRKNRLYHFVLTKNDSIIYIYLVLDFGILSYFIDLKIIKKIESFKFEIINILTKNKYEYKFISY
jgi:hypothetical protein